MEKELKSVSFAETVFVRVMISISLLSLAIFLSRETQNNNIIGWYYAMAFIISFIMLCISIRHSSSTTINKFLNYSCLFTLLLALIFVISFVDNVFDGPYHDFCRWPVFTIALAILISNLGLILAIAYQTTMFVRPRRSFRNLGDE